MQKTRQLVPKSEKMMQKTRENGFRTKTELLYSKKLIIIVLSGCTLFSAFTPLQIDSFTENKMTSRMDEI